MVARRHADNTLSDASQDQMPETGAPMGGHDNQIYLLGGRAFRYPLVGDTDQDASRDLQLCTRDRGEELIQLLLGLLLKGLE